MSWLRTLAMVPPPPDSRPVCVVEQEIQDELEFHIEMRTLDNQVAGMPPDEARRDALNRFGDFEQIRKACRQTQLGERIMLQRVQAVLTLILLGAVIFMGIALYRGQRVNEAATALMMQKNEAAMATMMEKLNQVPKQPSAAVSPQFEVLEPSALDRLFPRDGKLTAVQRGFRDWSEGTFPALDAAWWQALTPEERAAWEDKWLVQLSSPSEKKREVAIRCLAATGCKRAVPEVLKIAAERVEKDNADRCEAVRALGILGDNSLVPELVPLTYHYNMNTRLWAQVSLVRLTWENFGNDVAAWRTWWQKWGGNPPISEDTVAWATSPQMLQYADPKRQEESDRKFDPAYKKSSASSESSPTAALGKLASAVRQFARDAKLNEGQRAFRDHTEKTFANILNPPVPKDLTTADKAAAEDRELERLASDSASDRISAINTLALLECKKTVPGLLRIAAEHVEKDNRDRWMAVRALGIIGDATAVPELVHLTYHYNMNTRFWAQISLVRLTGENFGRDVAAWRTWWDKQGGTLPISDGTIAWATSPQAIEWADPKKQEDSDRKFLQGNSK